MTEPNVVDIKGIPAGATPIPAPASPPPPPHPALAHLTEIEAVIADLHSVERHAVAVAHLFQLWVAGKVAEIKAKL